MGWVSILVGLRIGKIASQRPLTNQSVECVGGICLHRVFFFSSLVPPKKFKLGKPRFGESTLT